VLRAGDALSEERDYRTGPRLIVLAIDTDKVGSPFPSQRGGQLESTLADAAIAGRFPLAALLGFVVGLERAYPGKAAGVRTYALIALGAAAFTGNPTAASRYLDPEIWIRSHFLGCFLERIRPAS
jgi:hypothetical protein